MTSEQLPPVVSIQDKDLFQDPISSIIDNSETSTMAALLQARARALYEVPSGLCNGCSDNALDSIHHRFMSCKGLDRAVARSEATSTINRLLPNLQWPLREQEWQYGNLLGAEQGIDDSTSQLLAAIGADLFEAFYHPELGVLVPT